MSLAGASGAFASVESELQRLKAIEAQVAVVSQTTVDLSVYLILDTDDVMDALTSDLELKSRVSIASYGSMHKTAA
jgi:hypothetical protein